LNGWRIQIKKRKIAGWEGGLRKGAGAARKGRNQELEASVFLPQ